MYDSKQAQMFVSMGWKAPAERIEDPAVLAQLEKIGASRQPINMKWYWLFPSEEATRIGRGIIRRWKAQNPAPDIAMMQKGWGSRPARPDSQGKYIDHFKDLRGCAAELVRLAKELDS